MRPFLILLMTITLAGCVSNTPTDTKHYIGGYEVVSGPDVYVDFDKHKNVTTVRGPMLRSDYRMFFKLVTLYAHPDWTSKIVTGPITLVINTDRYIYITSAYSFGEELTVAEGGTGIVISRSRLEDYIPSGGWRLQITTRGGIDEEIHVPAEYIAYFLSFTPDCEAWTECELPT